MKKTRIEIFRNNLWVRLNLGQFTKIKYNALINRIGNVRTREISHTNTFSLPRIEENVKALGLNIFNKKDLAKALNAKYPAKYYIENRLVQQGFLVINNTNTGTINVNFIDESLGLVETWGTTTFKELLQSPNINRPADYQAVIDGMKTYDMSKTSVLTPLPNVGTRGHDLASFPNTLNAIGDDFQISNDGSRVDDAFNPYQSRPVYNAKALLDLATESFGYTPIYDDSVEWDKVELNYIVNSGLGDDELERGGLVEVEYSNTNTPHYFHNATQGAVYVAIRYDNMTPSADNLVPNNVSGWTDPFGVPSGSYSSQGTLFVPDITAAAAGNITWRATADPTGIAGLTYTPLLYSIWENASAGGPPIQVWHSSPLNPQYTDNSSGDNLEIVFDKTLLETPPTGATNLIGVLMVVRCEAITFSSPVVNFGFSVSSITEESLPTGVVSYDENGQYIADEIDLTFAAPTRNIKQLISGFMEKEGILLDINNVTKEVLFFSYALYKTKRDEGSFKDWSNYYRKYSDAQFNTDYGNNYGRVNEIGLKEPYEGNTFKYSLSNQGEDSKYKEYQENANSLYSDVDGVVSVPNTNSPYTEFSNTRLGLVQRNGNITGLTQIRFDKSTQGTIPQLAHMQNINYLELPVGMSEWYRIVDLSVKVEAMFLLPLTEFRDLKLFEPIYVNNLGGFYIIEELLEYVDATQEVVVKLIKLLDN